MADYVTLLGAEQVQSAGRNITAAAERMMSAAAALDDVFERHHRFMDDWLQRFEAATKGDAS